MFIKASCPMCGHDPVNLLPQEVTVTENKISPEWSTFAFTCPECSEEVTKPASFEILALLATAKGVRWNVVRIPTELSEPHYVGPALTEQDVLDFVIDLNLTPDYLFSILAGGDK